MSHCTSILQDSALDHSTDSSLNSFVWVADQPANTANLLFIQGIELNPATIRFRWVIAFDKIRCVGIKRRGVA